MNYRNISKLTKNLFLAIFMLGLGVNAWAIPSTASTNLQVTTGVTTSTLGNTLTINSPDRAVLTWQNFGSGTDTIAAADTLNYVLPNARASVLNIVAGNASSTIDGAINSNGNVFVLNPNGVVIGGGARIEVNRLHLSTSDNPAFASYYFQQGGKLPSQDGLVPVAGTATINSGAIITVGENITIAAKNITAGGFVSQGNVVLNADGNVNVGTAGLTYVRGNLEINNPTGATVLGSAGNNLVVTENITSSSITGTFTSVGTANIQGRSLTVSGATVTADRVNANTVTATGNNVTVAVGVNTVSPVVNVTANGIVNVTAPASVAVGITNTGNGATTVNAAGSLTLNRVQVEGAAGASFTGASITDANPKLFVYGPASFTATTGNVSITKANHSFGPVSVNAAVEGVVYEDAALNLGTIAAPKFTGRSNNYAFQTGAINSPVVNITSPGNITLNAATNAIGSLTVSGSDVTVVNLGGVTLGNVNATGNLSVTSSAGIAQAVDTKVTSTGATTLVGTGLTLANAGNKFGALTVDVTAAGNATITEDTTLNLASLRAATAVLKSLDSVITSGTNAVVADNVTIEAVNNVTLLANYRSNNSLSVRAGAADLSLLSFATNLNSKFPTVIATSYKSPQP
jgi:filamentous hemagglutinin family protein